LHAIYPPSAKHEGNTTSSSLLNRVCLRSVEMVDIVEKSRYCRGRLQTCFQKTQILLNRVLVPMCQKRRYKHMDQFCVYKLEERILVDCPERTRLSGRRVADDGVDEVFRVNLFDLLNLCQI
ncbi:hypothetical protein KCU99_g122, partial [Aureobasidium melanogenum]